MCRNELDMIVCAPPLAALLPRLLLRETSPTTSLLFPHLIVVACLHVFCNMLLEGISECAWLLHKRVLDEQNISLPH